MIFLMNAIMFGVAASFWSRGGFSNIIMTLLFVAMAIVNAARAAPFVVSLFGV